MNKLHQVIIISIKELNRKVMHRITGKDEVSSSYEKERFEEYQKNSADIVGLSMQSVLDSLGFGVVLLQPSSEVAVVNKAASTLINARDWVRITDRRFRCSGKANVHIGERINLAVKSRNKKSTILLQSSRSGNVDSLLLTISPLGANGTALGILIDPFKNGTVDILPVKQLYSLTDAEADITSHLADGLDYTAIAAERNVSVTTIRSYSKSIFKKMAVNSRADVVRKVHTAWMPFSLV